MPFLLAERAIKMCSLDARNKGQPRPLFLKMYQELEGPRSTAAVKSSSRLCLVGYGRESAHEWTSAVETSAHLFICLVRP